MTVSAAHLGECAGMIRIHLWQPTMPVFHGEPREWSMGRELNIFKILVGAGFRPEDVIGAVSVVRSLKPDWTGPLSLRVFYWKRQGGFCATPFLEESIGYYLKRENVERNDSGRLPPSISSVLYGMIAPGSDTVPGHQNGKRADGDQFKQSRATLRSAPVGHERHHAESRYDSRSSHPTS